MTCAYLSLRLYLYAHSPLKVNDMEVTKKLYLSKISRMFVEPYGSLFNESNDKDVVAMTQEELCSLQPNITEEAKNNIQLKFKKNVFIIQSLSQIENCLCIGARANHNIGRYWDDFYVKAVVCLCCLMKETHHGVYFFPEVKPFKLLLSLNLSAIEREQIVQMQTNWSNLDSKNWTYFSMTCDLAEIIAEAISQSMQ